MHRTLRPDRLFQDPPRHERAREGGGTSTLRAAALLGLAAAAGVVFSATAVASVRRRTVPTDYRLHEAMRQRMETPAGHAAEEIAPLVDDAGKWWVYMPVAFTAAIAVLTAPAHPRREPRARRTGAAAVAVVPALVSLLSPAFDRWIPQPPVGPRRRPLDHPVFPSGHAFRTTGVALTAAYVVSREHIVPRIVAWPLAIAVSGTIGVARLIREKHLASDVLGGWLAGIGVSALAAAAHELTRGAAE